MMFDVKVYRNAVEYKCNKIKFNDRNKKRIKDKTNSQYTL